METSQTPPVPEPSQDTTPDSGATAPEPPTMEAMLHQLIEDQKQQRAETASLREELARNAAPVPTRTVDIPSEEERLKARMADIAKFPFYCPGCGKLWKYERECEGQPAAPHPPIDVVSTDELRGGDTGKHTPAPAVAA